MNIFIVQTVVMILLAVVIFYLIIYNNSLKLEKRIAKYSISSIKDDSISFFDLLANEYKKMVAKLTKVLKKSVFLKKYSLKFNKYITYENDKDVCAMDYVSNKFYICIAFILIITFARIIEGTFPSILDIMVSALLGFFLIDIYFKFYDYVKKKQIEQDLLKIIPPKYYKDINHLFIWHGRNICTARNPKCSECPVQTYCKNFTKTA